MYIKPDKPDGGKLNKVQVESDAPEINKWSMYTAYRYVVSSTFMNIKFYSS